MGYGILNIMAFGNEDLSVQSAQLSDTFPQAYIDEIYRAASTEIGTSDPFLFASVDKLFEAVHVYSHFDGPLFNVTTLNVKQNSEGGYAAYR